MKVRRREVNIFNMSLLDILCGALGAFCFMMLTLFPSYIAARDRDQTYGKDIESDWQEIQDDAGSFVIAARWETAADVDLFVKYPSGKVFGPKPVVANRPLEGTIADAKRGPGFEVFSVAGGDDRGSLTVYLRAASGGTTEPSLVHLCVFRRIRLLEDSQLFAWAPDPVSVPASGEIVTVGEFSVDPDRKTIQLVPTSEPLLPAP